MGDEVDGLARAGFRVGGTRVRDSAGDAMSTVDAALAAMDKDAYLARRVIANDNDPRFVGVVELMRDRLRLIEQHRGHLTTHSRWAGSPQPPRGPACEACGIAWPCPLVESVTHYWTERA